MGNAFLLQGGDCAEGFKEFIADNIFDAFNILAQMSTVLMFGGQLPVVMVHDIIVTSLTSLVFLLIFHQIKFFVQMQFLNNKQLSLICRVWCN